MTRKTNTRYALYKCNENGELKLIQSSNYISELYEIKCNLEETDEALNLPYTYEIEDAYALMGE